MECLVSNIAILGSTGSIGCQTLDIVRSFPSNFNVIGLAAGRNWKLLAQQIKEFRPEVFSSLHDPNAIRAMFSPECQYVPVEELVRLPQIDLIMAAIVGNAGLGSVIAALTAGKTVALANKEPIVSAGELVTRIARESGGTILPVDSEPSAIWQCIRGESQTVSRIIITASGGALRNYPLKDLSAVTPEAALRHPTWSMGKKITIDSATLINKAFEVIEAHWLFGIPWAQIDVVVHPESIIHSMVEFVDGSVKAHLGIPDMRGPIQYALFQGVRQHNPTLPQLNLAELGSLTFQPLDIEQYPCFSLALTAAQQGGTYPVVTSASDEVAVNLFLKGKIAFTDIHDIIRDTLHMHQSVSNPTLEDILAADAWARRCAAELAK